MNPGIFREYDIRGLVGSDLTEDVLRRIGRAFGTILVRKGRRRVALGRDVRHSSADFARALAGGMTAAGLSVLDCGLVPTPVLYWSILRLGADGGVMVTGSHNPIEYNGIKLCEGTLSIFGREIQAIREVAERGDFATGTGGVETVSVLAEYEADLTSRFRSMRPFRVAVDCGNGVAGPTVLSALRAAGHSVDALYCEPDGRFPNHLPDPEVPEYMQDLVRRIGSTGADAGFGFDGDGDRLGVIDEQGRKISADWLVAVFARDLLERHPGGKVRYDVKCGDFLGEYVRAHGGVPVMGRTGHSILKRETKDLDAILGGELSGHIVFGREYHLIDDPLFSALRLLELMGRQGKRCSELFDGIPRTFATAEIKAAVPEAEKFGVVNALTREFQDAGFDVITIDGARVRTPYGWGLVRASNTTANLTLRFESRTRDGLRRVQEEFLARLARHPFIDLANLRKEYR